MRPRDARNDDCIFDLKGFEFPVLLRPCGGKFKVVLPFFIDRLATARIQELVEQGELIIQDLTIC